MLVPKRMGASEKESTGGSPAFAARVSAGETPAKWQKVALFAAARLIDLCIRSREEGRCCALPVPAGNQALELGAADRRRQEAPRHESVDPLPAAAAPCINGTGDARDSSLLRSRCRPPCVWPSESQQLWKG